ncbi:hypothetical protein AB0B28_01075 [Glycomyces sp. NPDC046736]|uniref:hypothetical protein n=1 Tax=Glycomyces sp. NPDC046736 TaxID=3155615 RepID=UPI00340E1B2F
MTGAFLHPDLRSAVAGALAAEVGARLTDIYLPDGRAPDDLWAIGRAPDDRTPGNRFRDVARHVRVQGRRALYIAADGTRTALNLPRGALAAHREPLVPRSAAVVWSQFPAPDTRVYVPVSGTFDLGGMADMVVVSGNVVYRLTVDVGPRALKRFVPDVSRGFDAGP